MVIVPAVTVWLAALPPNTAGSPAVHWEIVAVGVKLSLSQYPPDNQLFGPVVVLSLWPFPGLVGPVPPSQ